MEMHLANCCRAEKGSKYPNVQNLFEINKKLINKKNSFASLLNTRLAIATRYYELVKQLLNITIVSLKIIFSEHLFDNFGGNLRT